MLGRPNDRLHCNAVRFVRVVAAPVSFNMWSPVPSTEPGMMISKVCACTGVGEGEIGEEVKILVHGSEIAKPKEVRFSAGNHMKQK